MLRRLPTGKMALQAYTLCNGMAFCHKVLTSFFLVLFILLVLIVFFAAFKKKVEMAVKIVRNADMSKDLRDTLFVSFEKHYKQFFESDGAMNGEKLDAWIETQFKNNAGDVWIVFNNDNFLTYSEKQDCVVVYHLCAQSDTYIILLLKKLATANRKKRFIASVRKSDEKTMKIVKEVGCKIIRNQLPNFPSTDYYSIEMLPSLAMQLTLLPSDLLAAIYD